MDSGPRRDVRDPLRSIHPGMPVHDRHQIQRGMSCHLFEATPDHTQPPEADRDRSCAPVLASWRQISDIVTSAPPAPRSFGAGAALVSTSSISLAMKISRQLIRASVSVQLSGPSRIAVFVPGKVIQQCYGKPLCGPGQMGGASGAPDLVPPYGEGLDRAGTCTGVGMDFAAKFSSADHCPACNCLRIRIFCGSRTSSEQRVSGLCCN